MAEDGPVVTGGHRFSGSIESFEAFYQREYRSVLGLASVLSGNVSLAEDLTQEAFVATMRQWDRVGQMENPGAWVRKVVANGSVSRFRRAMVEFRAAAGMGDLERDRSALAGEVAIDIWSEIRRLPRRQAQVVALTYLLDLTRREVGETLGCSEETVKTHLERARKQLTDRLSSYGDK